MKRDVETPAEYLAQIPAHQTALLQSLRTTILQAFSDISEGIRYGMLDYPGLANLAAQKAHVSLYVAPAVLAEFKSRFPGVSCGKSCLRFTRVEQIDESAILDLLHAVRRARLSAEPQSAG
ncbi:MAG: DUF1801 domain-containing protein [Inquilinus sp.]|nr:DUF1801 domain-containing protein [Inquilinus sp.]